MSKLPQWNFVQAVWTPTITAGAYSASDVIGGRGEIDVRHINSKGAVVRVIICDDDNEKAAGTLYFFHTAPASFADNAAFALTFADMQKLAGTVAVAASNYVTVNGNAVADIPLDNAVDFDCSGTGYLYVYFVPSGTPTYTTTADLAFLFTVYES